MNEIKERLEQSLDYEFQLSFNERKELLNYITKLEEEKEDLQEELEEEKRIEQEDFKTIQNLEEENKRLLKIKKYAEEVGNRRNELYERIDKAIEYIENPSHEMSVNTYQNLLNILQGDNKE